MNQQQIITNQQEVAVEDVNLKNKKALYELMVRDGWFLAKLSSKFMNQKMMNLIRNKKIFAVFQRQVVYRICCSPPSKEALVKKYEDYVAAVQGTSGIDHDRENYPDKDYLVLLIATLSNGNDEIFHKTYMPPSSDKRKNGV
jgi:hypothetical protein